jgi:arylsulfatase A-like enzyme
LPAPTLRFIITAEATMTRPNILFILADDLGWRDLSCYGSTFYETPHLDRLAQQGMRFTDAYAAAPVCSPTRASILTGLYPATVGITDWIDSGGRIHPCRGRLTDAPYVKHLPSGINTLAQALAAAGYAAWHVGKWHLGGEGHLPEDHGFEINIGGCQIGSPGRGGYFSPWSIPALEESPVPAGTHLDDYLTDCAINLIRKPTGRPFFLNLCYYSVHTPIQAKADKVEKYRRKAHETGLDALPAFEAGEFFPTEHKKDQRVVRRLLQSDPTYAAMVETLDDNVGRLLRALDETGAAENTLVIFTSDNGGLATSEGSPTCNAPLSEGKGWMYEGGVREPLIVRWPGVVATGDVCRDVVTSPDFCPTLLEAAEAGASAPGERFDGVSLMPLLRGEKRSERGPVFWHYPHYGNQGGTPAASVRLEEYKLIEFYEDGRLELYHLGEDSAEAHDLAAAQPDRVRQMHARLSDWRARVEAKMPQVTPGRPAAR